MESLPSELVQVQLTQTETLSIEPLPIDNKDREPVELPQIELVLDFQI
jgi:hypothetical protein